MPPKKADSKNGDSPSTTSNQRAPPGNPQQNVDRHRTNPSDHIQSTVASRSSQQPPQRVGSGSEARPSSSGGPVTANSWAKVAAGHSRGSLSQLKANQLPTHPVVMPLPPGVTQGPTFGTPQHQIPQTNVPTPNSRQRASQELQQVPSHAQSANPMNTIRSGISSMNLDAATGISQKASPSPQFPHIHQSSKSQLQQVAYPSSTDRMPALPATKSSAPAAVSSTKPSAADSNRQSKASDEESPQDGQSKVSSSLIKRPQYCNAGTPLRLYANFFKLNVSKSVKLVSYSIEVTRQDPSVEITNGGLRSQCIRLALQEARFLRYRNRIVTDHQANLYSVGQLSEELHTTNIQYRDEHHQTTDPNARIYVVALKEGRTIDISSLVPKIVSEDLTIGKESRSEILTALNIFLHDFAQRQPTSITYLRDKCFHLGHHSSRHNLFGGLEAIPGFFSSVRPASDTLMVNVNPSRGAFYKVLRLDHLMYEWDEAWKDRGSWDAVELDALQAFLKGLRIKALHLNKKDGKGNPCPWIKRISGLAQTTDGQTPPPPRGDKTKPPAQDPSKIVTLPPVVDVKGANPSQVQFWHDKKNMYVSVSDHFKEEYPGYPPGGDLSRSLWCVVNVGSQERPIYLPAEACEVLPGQAHKKKLSPQQTTKMIEVAVRRPFVNKKAIEQDGLRSVGLSATDNNKMDSFGLTLPSSSLLTVEARQLPLSSVRYAKGTKPEWSTKIPTMWNMSRMEFETPAKDQHWTYVRIRDQNDPLIVEPKDKIADALKQRLSDHGMSVSLYTARDQKNHQIEFDSRPGALNEPLRMFLDQVSRRGVRFLLIILPDNDANRYSRLKLLCDKTYGVKNVCVLAETDSGDKPKMSNLCLKVNLKMGGVNFVAPARSLDFIEAGATMVIGIDVTHGSATSAESTPSVAAMVASMDCKLAHWPAELRVQSGSSRRDGGLEMTSFNLEGMLVEHLRRWRAKHGKLPNNLLVFRDGISEGQYEESLQTELPKLRAACEQDWEKGHTTTSNEPVKITFIVCAKRHHTRFYKPTDKPGQVVNPLGGTYVDKDITESYPWDFYLQSHTALKGTARPAHYIVLHDEIIKHEASKPRGDEAPIRPADLIAQITHNMCYLFGRSTSSVSICPAVYYADLACTRARCYLMDLYNNTPQAPQAPPASAGESALENWQKSLQARLDLPANVKDHMFYI